MCPTLIDGQRIAQVPCNANTLLFKYYTNTPHSSVVHNILLLIYRRKVVLWYLHEMIIVARNFATDDMTERIAQGARGAATQLEKINKNAAGIVDDKSPSAADLALRIAELCGQIHEKVGNTLEKSGQAKSELGKALNESRTALNTLRSAGVNDERAPAIFSTAHAADGEVTAALELIGPPEKNLEELRDLASTMQENFGQVASVLQNGEAGVATGGVAQAVVHIQGLAAEGAASGVSYARNLQGGS